MLEKDYSNEQRWRMAKRSKFMYFDVNSAILSDVLLQTVAFCTFEILYQCHLWHDYRIMWTCGATASSYEHLSVRCVL